MSDLRFLRYVLRTDIERTAGIIFDMSKDPVQILHISNDLEELGIVCDNLNDYGRRGATDG